MYCTGQRHLNNKHYSNRAIVTEPDFTEDTAVNVTAVAGAAAAAVNKLIVMQRHFLRVLLNRPLIGLHSILSYLHDIHPEFANTAGSQSVLVIAICAKGQQSRCLRAQGRCGIHHDTRRLKCQKFLTLIFLIFQTPP